LNKILIDHLKQFEGCKLTAYKCPAGIWTVGWGATGKDIKEGTTWTDEQAEKDLIVRSNDCIEAALKISPILITCNDYRQAAIASFIYNCGADAYRKSTLKLSVDKQHWQEAAAQLMRWTHVGGKALLGLERRRAFESLMITHENNYT